jgi:asparagine synthase (glutamine-hydrolysing)
MCGFAGEIRTDGAPASAARVAAMAEPLAPRGPDGEGLWMAGGVALAHRRLRIIDLSERAAQPMVDPESGLAIVYNGAIYNYLELRSELAALGHRFFSTGDTEVVLRAYRQWGEACVEHLHGMFAFAIHDRDAGQLLLARDRLGIKPLYLAEGPGWVRFASTLPSLLAGSSGDIDTSLDPVALHHYFSLHSIVPPPRTLLSGVRKLPPASTLLVRADGTRERRQYWSLQPRPDPRPTFEDWQDELLAALRRSVKRRLVADVPVGVLLSGGLDSSLVVGLLREAGQSSLSTFSVGFQSVGDLAGDEFAYSDFIAARYETDHHRVQVDTASTLLHLDACIHAMSEPMVSHDNIGFFLLSREVARSVKVVQSGQGADEVFAGYHWYPPLLHADDRAVDAYAGVFFDRDHAEYARTVQPQWVGRDHARDFVAARFAALGSARAVDKALWLDTHVMLVDDPVKRVDNMTMAWGLEARVPFLDHELVELATRIPAEHKVRDGGKGVLKAVARRIIPSEVIDRPKGYFPVPALTYLRGEILERVRDVLGSARARQRGVVSPAYLAELFAEPEGRLTPLGGSKLWQVALLEMWLQARGL